MKRFYYILLGVTLAACSKGVVPPVYTVGEADNAIVLSAGMSDGGSGVVTKAAYGTEDFTDFTEGTGLKLYIEGTWLGHDPETVIYYPTASVGAADADHKSSVSFAAAQQPYWDNYGMADPANMPGVVGNGREKGLTIYGAAVNTLETAPTVTDGQWEAFPWTLDDNQSTNDWVKKDLLTSNNVRIGTTEGTYKFNDRQSGKLLKFTHAMSMITVNLIAGKGFPGYETNPESAKFVNSPTVTLDNFKYTGTVNIKTKVASPSGSTTVITPKTAVSGTGSHTAQYTALIFPEQALVADQQILTLDADGNKYYVNSNKLITAMNAQDGHNKDMKFEDGVNYVLNITVNKTDIDVEATIKDWVDVSATNETPVINIAEVYGQTGTGFNKSFDFYRSTSVTGSYLTGLSEGNYTRVNYTASPAAYTMATQMYWPNHSTHYFFRGIWPLVDSVDDQLEPKQLGPTSSQVKANSIEVANVAYKQGYYPSDLMIGIPRKEGGYDETCKVGGHDKSSGANGICATEGKIRMNFEYAMSQVIVNLTTSEGNDKVIFDANTSVEILGGYSSGEIKLSDESSDFTGKTVTNYTMNRADAGVHTNYHDAIIPQKLVDGSGNATLKFRITVKSGDTYDKYETVLGIKDIQVSENGGEKKNITAWEHGKKYTYTLHITKTGIKVEATMKDWVTVSAGEDVWF